VLNRADLRACLDDLRQNLAPFAGLGAGAFHPVMIRPSLGFAMVPRPKDKRAQAEGARDDEARKRERIAASLDFRPPGPGGLVEGSEFDALPPTERTRQGMAGLTSAGAGKVEDLCSLVRQDRGLYAIWTVTLPPEAAQQLDQIENGATRFGDVIRRRFGEALRRALGPDLLSVCGQPLDHWWFVVEPQKSGRPHWHFVFRCKVRKGRPWLLGKGRLDRLIRFAMRTVTGQELRSNAAGNVQALRSDPGRYLSKYLRKGAQQGAGYVVMARGWSVNLVPRRWWGCSRSALALLVRYRFELPSYLVGALSVHWPQLVQIGKLKARIWQPDAPGAPAMVVGSWCSAGKLLDVVRMLAELAEYACTSGRTYGYT
jgi:hypothetical protein